MAEVFNLTLNAVGILLIYISIGYFLRRHHDLLDEAGHVLSLLCTLLFSPAYSIVNLSGNFTMDVIGEKLIIFGYGILFVLAVFGVSILLSKPFSKDSNERRSLIYAFAIPNFGYFGYPVIQAVFGDAMLADVMVFLIPLSLATNSIGYVLFMQGKRIPWRTVLISPMVLCVFVGAAIGISGVQLPPMLQNVLSALGNCMSPASMLLAGFMLGKFPLKKLLSGIRPYYLSAVRLILIPLLFGAALWFSGLRDTFLMLPLLVTGLPLGLNLVVYPESQGQERIASDNAKLCFISYLLSLILLPVTFSVLSYLTQ